MKITKITAKHYLKIMLGAWLISLATIRCSSPPTPALPDPPSDSAIEIALLLPMSGELNSVGRHLRNGYEMAITDWNKQGDLLGQSIRWRLYDSGCDFVSGQESMRQVIEDGHRLVVGPLCSEGAMGAATVAEQANLLLLIPTATHPLVTVDKHGTTRSNVFRIATEQTQQGQYMADVTIKQLGMHNAAIMTEHGDDYSLHLSQGFKQQFVARGGTIVHETTYLANSPNFSDSLIALTEAGAELIYLPGRPEIVQQVNQQLTNLNLSPAPLLMGGDSWQKQPTNSLPLIEGYMSTHFQPTPDNQAWIERYQAMYALEPDTLAVLGYDAVFILLQAIQHADTIQELNKIKQNLETNQFETVLGKAKFNQQHDLVRPMPVILIKQGQTKIFTRIDRP